MPIDVSAKRSPGWWLQRQFNLLANQARQNRLNMLLNYRYGKPPLPEGADNARELFEAFQRKSRSNFAELIVAAVKERMLPLGFGTAIDGDETGDPEAGAMWRRAGMKVSSKTVHDFMITCGESYVIVGGVDEETQAPVVTAEDPRWTHGEREPGQPQKLMAAVKVLHDDAEGEDRAYLYLPGRMTQTRRSQVWVARRPANFTDFVTTSAVYWETRTPIMYFNPDAWDWDLERSGELQHGRMPVVRFDNENGMGEFESHIDVLDRINHGILQRMVIATLQAFRQRAIKGLPLKDKNGKEIDYRDVFTMDPAALWQLPQTAEMWESGVVDLTPILSSVKDDIVQLATVTRTPFSMLTPEGANQSAEGASLQREGLVLKTEDRTERATDPWAQVVSLMMLQSGQPERADIAGIDVKWAPPNRLSLSERADAATKAVNDLPLRMRLTKIWGLTPSEADEAMTELAAEQLQKQLAAQTFAAMSQPQPQPAQQPTDRQPAEPGQPADGNQPPNRRGNNAGGQEPPAQAA